MKPNILLVLSLFIFVVQLVARVRADANGGTDCAACTIVVGLVEQLAQVHTTDVISAAQDHLCNNLPEPFNESCSALLNLFGPTLIDAVYHKETPDVVCHKIGFCTQDPGKSVCHLFPLPTQFKSEHWNKAGKKLRAQDLCDLPGVAEVCQLLSRFTDDHLPLQDKDGDRFGLKPTLRGSNWRGKDCNDLRNDFYPGRVPLNQDREVDSNCNGIYGVDPVNGMPYEDLYCGAYSRGVALLGDSAGAHFHIPPNYFMAKTMSKETFKDLKMVLTNEFDWPMLSSVTAYTDNAWSDIIKGPVDSLYMRFLKNNQCNHRDFQNIGVNGARSSSMVDIVKGLARNKTNDHPLFVVLALIGNDVCNGHVDTLESMTKPEEYSKNMLATLNYLNDSLPQGSVVVMNGLVDGRVLWDTMHDRIHPLGELNQDVKYSDLYGYMNCLEVSPCTGWLTSNDTLRNLTYQRASELSKQAKIIANTKQFKSFQLIYQDYDIKELMQLWISRGGEAHELIDPFDGFHPGQVAQSLSAEHMYTLLEQTNQEAIGKTNANNNKIMEQFGDQGGY